MDTTIWSLSDSIRSTAPLVQNITNLVVQNDTADAIAAVGATQVTLHTTEEARAAASVCAALALNLGTLNEEFLRCARLAVQTMDERGRGWVLDPVAAGMTPYRGDAAREFLKRGPSVLKANASEIIALAGGSRRGRGADSVDRVEDATDAAVTLARRHGCVVVVTGSTDLVTDGDRSMLLQNGHPMMGFMIGSGCMLTSIVGCYLAVADNLFEAAVAAVTRFNIAGEIAAGHATGPGTLKPLLIDALFNTTREDITTRLRQVA